MPKLTAKDNISTLREWSSGLGILYLNSAEDIFAIHINSKLRDSDKFKNIFREIRENILRKISFLNVLWSFKVTNVVELNFSEELWKSSGMFFDGFLKKYEKS